MAIGTSGARGCKVPAGKWFVVCLGSMAAAAFTVASDLNSESFGLSRDFIE